MYIYVFAKIVVVCVVSMGCRFTIYSPKVISLIPFSDKLERDSKLVSTI